MENRVQFREIVRNRGAKTIEEQTQNNYKSKNEITKWGTRRGAKM